MTVTNGLVEGRNVLVTPAAGGGGGATILDGLTDVTIDGTPADNELLAFDTGAGEFINQTAAEAGLGDMVGPASSTDEAIMRFNGTTGKLAQDSANGPTIDDAGDLFLQHSAVIGQSGTPRFELRWGVDGANDRAQIGIRTGSTTNGGYLELLEKEDIGSVNRRPASFATDPTLRIYSSDATNADDYLDFYHNQTDAIIEAGSGGDLIIRADSTKTTVVGRAGDTELGDGTLRMFGPNTDLKMDFGNVTHRVNDCWVGGRMFIPISTANLSATPTDAELDTEFGTPTAGFIAWNDDNGAGTSFRLIGSDGTSWFYSETVLTKAV